jgi:ATP synthase protein I
MLANDARILARSAVATAAAGAIMIAIAGFTGGGKGALGAVLGVMLVTIFFTASVVVVSLAERRWGQGAMMGAALGTFVAKILILLAVLSAFQGTTVFNTKIFGLTAIVCILVWNGGQVFTLARRPMPYVVPKTGEASTPEARHLSGER